MADNEVKVALPSPLENLQLPDPALVTYYDNAINHRCFWIDYDIDETLLELAAEYCSHQSTGQWRAC